MSEIPKTFKIIAKVIDIPEPKRIKPDLPLHVTWPCRIYKIGYKMTFNCHELVMEETDAVCLSALEGLLSNVKLHAYGVYPMSKWVEEKKKGEKNQENKAPEVVGYYRCSDLERPVEFEITRVPVDLSERFPSHRTAVKRPGWEQR
jgi:uncharacterized repeat protein (TIGR04076 family)